MGNPLAVQLYTVRDELADDRARVLQRIAGFGYGAVEPFDVISDPDGLRADLDAAGLAVCSVHARPFGDQADAAFRGAQAVGADTVIVPHMPPERFAGADGVRALEKRVASLEGREELLIEKSRAAAAVAASGAVTTHLVDMSRRIGVLEAGRGGAMRLADT